MSITAAGGFSDVYKVYCRAEWFNPNACRRPGPVILACNHAASLIRRSVAQGWSAASVILPGITLSAFRRRLGFSQLGRRAGGSRWRRCERFEDDPGPIAGRGASFFPEGTRTLDGKLQPARSGIGLTVIKSSAPVVPVRVFGTF